MNLRCAASTPPPRRPWLTKLTDCGRPMSRSAACGRWSPSCWRTPTERSSEATTSTTSAPPWSLTRSGSAGDVTRQLVFIGFMGSGKTTAARSAATALGTEPVDSDHGVELRLGKPIGQIFSEDGEPAFRAAEEEVALQLLRDPAKTVVSLGGGAVGSRRVREALG